MHVKTSTIKTDFAIYIFNHRAMLLLWQDFSESVPVATQKTQLLKSACSKHYGKYQYSMAPTPFVFLVSDADHHLDLCLLNS